MTIRFRYFGQIAELVGKEEELKELSEGTTVQEVEMALVSTYKLEDIYYRIALNQRIEENKEIALNNNDEVAFMPPFAGG